VLLVQGIVSGMVPCCKVISLHCRMRVMVYFNRVNAASPHPSENPGDCRDVKERKQELLVSARPLLAAGKTR